MSTHAPHGADNPVPQTPAADLPADLSERTVLLDVREDDEWAAGHAPDAVHVPLGALTGRAGDVAARAGAGQVVVVCRSGSRSQQAAMFLAAAGLDVVNVADGMQGWARAGRAMVSESGAPATVL